MCCTSQSISLDKQIVLHTLFVIQLPGTADTFAFEDLPVVPEFQIRPAEDTPPTQTSQGMGDVRNEIRQAENHDFCYPTSN